MKSGIVSSSCLVLGSELELVFSSGFCESKPGLLQVFAPMPGTGFGLEKGHHIT